MNLWLTLQTGNAAFEDDALGHELARIFREQAEKVEDQLDLVGLDLAVRDVNGNRVGTFYAGGDEAPDCEKPYLLASIEMGNAAFEDAGAGNEVARILREAADKLEDRNFDFGLRDYNGNRVGAVLHEAEEPEANHDNDGGSGPKDPEPRDPLLGDVFTARNGEAWIVARCEMVPARDGTARSEPLYLLVNEDDKTYVDFKYGKRLSAEFGNEFASAYGTEGKRKYGYFINLDERGEFYADVRDETGTTIFEVRIGSGEEDESNPVEDGFMSHNEDIEGLQEHLADVGLIQKGDEILTARDFEKYQERVTEFNGEAKSAFDRSQVKHWYGTVQAQESDGPLLESMGAKLGDFDTAAGRFAVKLTAEARQAIEALGTSFPLAVQEFSDQDKHLAKDEYVEEMTEDVLKPYEAFLRYAVSEKSDEGWRREFAQSEFEGVLQELKRGEPQSRGTDGASPTIEP